MSQPRDLKFTSEAQIIDDVQRLRRGWSAAGNWTLSQACYHLALAPNTFLKSPSRTTPNDAEKPMQARIEKLIGIGVMPRGLPIAPGTEPPADANDSAIDDLIAATRMLADYREPLVDFGPFGPMPTPMFRTFIFIHAANHLSNFFPAKADRRSAPRYADLPAMIADINQLRRGYTMGGRWSLPQICWHINRAYPMPLATADSLEGQTDAQRTRQQRWDYYIANGRPPEGFEAPKELVPPANCSEAEIDGLLQRLEALRRCAADFVQTAAGVMPMARARGFMLAHGWWHLSCLHPTMYANKQ